MNLTIELEPEVEQRLGEKAAANGLKVENYVKCLIEKNINGKNNFSTDENSVSELLADKRLQALDKLIASRQNTGEPFLSDEATRRESIYEDRF